MALHPSRHVTADVTYLALKDEYDRLMQADPLFAAGMAAKARAAAQARPGPSVMPLLGALSTATAEQKRLVGILCRGVMGLTISGALADPADPSQRLILEFRNRALARFVAEAPAGKIYITYGAAHFPGFLAELQKLDPGFRVQSVTAVAATSIILIRDDMKAMLIDADGGGDGGQQQQQHGGGRCSVQLLSAATLRGTGKEAVQNKTEFGSNNRKQ
jgi:hypothetical protein